MIFNITDIDLVTLTQALYAFAEPAGLGKLEYKVKDRKGVLVNGLPINEARQLVSNQEDLGDRFRIADYYNGVPLKLDYRRVNSTNQLITSSTRYDLRNGKYRFFEAMLNIFPIDEILIYQKSYPSHMQDQVELTQPQRPLHQIKIFETLIRKSIRHEDKRGTYWIIDGSLKSLPEFLYEN